MDGQALNSDNQYDLLCQVLPGPVVQASELCALPHTVDDGLGYRILHDFAHLNGTARAIWTEIKHLPFVYPYEKGQWRFDDSARNYFRARLEQRNGTYKELHRYLKDYFEEARQRIEDSNAPQARELDWRAAYHLAPLAPDEAVRRLTTLGQRAAQANRLADVRGVIDLFEEQERWLSPYQVARAYFEGRYAYAKGDYPEAGNRFTFVWERGQPNEIKAIAGHLLGQVVERRADRASLRQAEGLYRESLEIGENLWLRHHVAMVLNGLGGVLVRLGGRKREEEAENLYRQSLELNERLEDRRGQAMVLISLARLAEKRGDIPLAYEYVAQIISINKALGNHHFESRDQKWQERLRSKMGG